MSTTSLKLEKRVHIAGRFMDNNFYLQYLRYFDILAQVHSVVETRYGTWILRIWRAQRFGPEKYVKSREVRFFRVLQESFNKYIVPPEPKIAKAIEVYGKEMMMEIEVYDEHRDMLEALTSGDFVAVINVHYARGGAFDSLKLHGGSFYNRGIAKVPEHFPDPKFQSIKRKVERALEEIHNYEDYVEFVDQSKTASMQSCISTSTSSMPMPPKSIYHSQPVSRKYRSFAAARSAGKESFAQPCSKIIIGDLIAVDWFGKRDARKYHFLTHAHSDHCRQLDRRWGQKVFCSQKTAMILPQVMGYESNRDVPPGIIHPLDEDTPHQFEGFTVTLVDANHCPGSVMFVFEGDEIPGGRVLCTGDFRADANLMKLLEPEQKLHWMTQKKFETIYLDNTYLSLSVSFPDRVTAGLELFKKVQAHKGKNIYIPLHRLGREEMLEELSRQMMEPVMAYEEKKTMACTMSYFFEFGIKNEVRTIRVVKRNKWQLVEGEEHLDFVIFDVSMLHHMTTSDPMIEMHKHQVIRIPYSDHSSREEIIRFLKKLRFSAVVPCSKKVTQQELELMLACSNEKDVSLKACEEKLVIEHADEEGVMTNGKEESHRKKRDYYEKERDVEMDRIVEKTKELDVEQRSPLEPENIVEDVPIEEDYEDPANYSMNEAAMESTLEAMVESTVHHGLLAQDEDEEPGPSHNMNHLNLDLDMDLNLNLGLAMSPTPSPLAHTFSSSRNHNSHHQNHMPRHRHHSSHSQQDHVADIQIPGHLEIDDVSMFVERADEAHLHMRLNSPEEPPLETLHLNQWNQKIPEPRGLVFSPQYPQEIEANHVRIEEKRHITDERTQTVPTVEDTLHVLEQETQSDEPVMEPYVEPEVEHEDMDISESEPEEEPEKDPESVVEPTEVEQEDEEPEKQVEEQEEVPEDEEEILDETEVIPEEEEQVEEEEEIIEKVPTPSYENYQDAEDEMPETIIEPTVSHATIEEDQVEEEVAEEIPEEQQPTTSASVAIVVSSPLADEVTLNEHPIKIIEPAPTPSPSLSPPPPAPVEPTPSPTPTPTPTPTPSPTPSPEVKPKRRKGGRKKGTRRRGGKAAVKPPEKVLAMEEEGKEEEQQEEREKEKEEEKAEEEEEEEVQEPKKVVTNGHREREMTVEDEEVEMEKAVEEEEEEQVETEPEPSPLHELWPAEELQHTELEIDEPEAEPEEPEYVEPEYVAEPEPEPEEEEEEDDDYEEEQEIERDLDKWSEGPPKSLKEAIARLQQPSSRRRQFAQ